MNVLPYADLTFPEAPPDRPYTFINMVATIDGKILTGNRDEPVMDLGSEADHAVMRRIELSAQAVIVGAGSLRATKGIWYPKELIRIVVSKSGQVPFDSRFFTDSPHRAFVCSDATIALPDHVRQLPLDLLDALRILRQDEGVTRLLCEGGSELNASLLRLNLVDEVFITIAPKIKLGREVPTYAGGDPLPRADIQQYAIVEFLRINDELFIRYRRQPNA